MKPLIRFTLTALLALIATTFAHAGEKITYIHNDALGSPVAATNQLGQVIWRETYKPHGQRTTNAAASANNRVWFTGKQEESALGINYFGARWYHPEVGRFLVIDPVGVSPDNIHSFNRYGYANNNPYKYVDPDGRHPAIIFGVGVGLGAVFGTNNAQAPTSSGDLHPNMDTKTLEAAGAISALGGLRSLLGRGAANGVDDVGNAAHNAADGLRLNKSLASQQQVGELNSGVAERIAGAGTDKALRDASRLSKEHGGNAGDWAKVRSSSKTHSDGVRQETHAYQNAKTNQVVEHKTKISGH